MDVPPVVLLYDYDGPALVLPCASGVRYRNQAAGHACWKFEIEGVLVPLPLPEATAARRALEEHFDGGWESLTPADADVIDRILVDAHCGFAKVDRMRLHESYEAWVHVTLSGLDADRRYQLFAGIDASQAVLTWENSD